MRKPDIDRLRTAFLRAWVRTYYSRDEDDAHAETPRQDARELKQLTRIGVYRYFEEKRRSIH